MKIQMLQGETVLVSKLIAIALSIFRTCRGNCGYCYCVIVVILVRKIVDVSSCLKKNESYFFPSLNTCRI